MKLSRKILSVILSLCILSSAAVIGSFSAASAETVTETVSAAFYPQEPELVQNTVQVGAILHGFCRSFRVRACCSSTQQLSGCSSQRIQPTTALLLRFPITGIQ